MDPNEMLTPRQVAKEFGVIAKTVSRWGLSGKLPSIRTAGGHHRFRRSDVQALLDRGRNGRDW